MSLDETSIITAKDGEDLTPIALDWTDEGYLRMTSVNFGGHLTIDRQMFVGLAQAFETGPHQ